MQTLHLYACTNCLRNCPLCCNKKYPVKDIPIVTPQDIESSDMICITGGDPLLPQYLVSTYGLVQGLRSQIGFGSKKIIIYTSGAWLMHYTRSLIETNGQHWTGRILYKILWRIDGINISPKKSLDVEAIKYTFSTNLFRDIVTHEMTNRLYVFPEMQDKIDREIISKGLLPENFSVFNREWQEDFQPASDSIFRRLSILF